MRFTVFVLGLACCSCARFVPQPLLVRQAANGDSLRGAVLVAAYEGGFHCRTRDATVTCRVPATQAGLDAGGPWVTVFVDIEERTLKLRTDAAMPDGRIPRKLANVMVDLDSHISEAIESRSSGFLANVGRLGMDIRRIVVTNLSPDQSCVLKGEVQASVQQRFGSDPMAIAKAKLKFEAAGAGANFVHYEYRQYLHHDPWTGSAQKLTIGGTAFHCAGPASRRTSQGVDSSI